jgi:hypothetical protein
LLNNIHKSLLIKGAICTVGLSGGGGIIPLSLKKLSEGALAPLAPHNYATGYYYYIFYILLKYTDCIVMLHLILNTQ